MSEKKWLKISENIFVAFFIPCTGSYQETVCLQANIERNTGKCHGHIQISDHEGLNCSSHFPCQSRAGVEIALGWMTAFISKESWVAIFQIPEIQALPQELTEEEATFIAFADRAEKAKAAEQKMPSGWFWNN